jgi:hypothetical protein
MCRLGSNSPKVLGEQTKVMSPGAACVGDASKPRLGTESDIRDTWQVLVSYRSPRSLEPMVVLLVLEASLDADPFVDGVLLRTNRRIGARADGLHID